MSEPTHAERVLGDFVGNAGHVVAISVGIPDWELGRVTLRVAGDGAVRVEQRGSAGDNDYTATWAAARTERFAALLRDNAALDLAPIPGDRLPDDVPVDVVVMDGEETVHSAALWHADREQDPHLDAILTAVDDAVREVSGGALP